MTASLSDALPHLSASIEPAVRTFVDGFVDLALLVDREGVISHIAASRASTLPGAVQGLVGKRLSDALAPGSDSRTEALLHEIAVGTTPRVCELRLAVDGHGEIPFKFTTAMLDDGQLAAFGLDLRQLRNLGQQVVAAQQEAAGELARMRQVETHYRVLFHVAAEGVLYVAGALGRIVDVNPAAASMLGMGIGQLEGGSIRDLFERERRPIYDLLVEAAAADGELRLRTRGESPIELDIRVHTIRQGGVDALLLRLRPAVATAAGRAPSIAARVFPEIPDGFVLTTAALRVLGANHTFADLVRHEDLIGLGLERWFPDSVLSPAIAELRARGSFRDVEVSMRSEVGVPVPVLVTAVAVATSAETCYAFTVRRAPPAVAADNSLIPGISELRELIGRVPLREIVRRSSEVIAQLCVDAALELTGDNRAAAAQLLGISRQSLYTRIRR